MSLTIVLDNVRSLNNIGAIFRTCDAFAVERLMLCGISACPPSREIHKTALGAEDSVSWQYFPDTYSCIESLQREGYTLCCLEQVKGSIELQEFTPQPGRRYALVLGHEVEGVAQEIVNQCDVCLEIRSAAPNTRSTSPSRAESQLALFRAPQSINSIFTAQTATLFEYNI